MFPEPCPARPVVVVGAGWAGLTVAVELTSAGLPVVLVESARRVGGRARSVRFGDTMVDNGQHLALGAYHALLALLRRLGVERERVFLRLPLTLHSLRGTRPTIHLSAARLPAPLHLLAGLLSARGLSLNQRRRALWLVMNMKTANVDAQHDLSVRRWLNEQRQSAPLVAKLWEPLCLAVLNTPPEQASARLFASALRNALSGSREDSDLLIPRVDLDQVLPVPASSFLRDKGAGLMLGQAVTGLAFGDGRIRAVRLGERRLEASQVVLATPHQVSRRLMSRHALLQPLCDRLAALGNEPVATLYLQYSPRARLPHAMVGLQGTTAQWLFDHRFGARPGLIAAVISARGSHCSMPRDRLTEQVAAELSASFPQWPAYRHSLLLRHKHATFTSRVGVDLVRPACRTPVAGLWLAGDYTDTGLPATLESAVRSGMRCAAALLHTVPAQHDRLA
jgi:squalene-associated FAD-dependent desaturase